MAASLPTGIVAFLFTDIQGSTPLWEREPDAMRESLARHNAALRAAIAENGGHVYKTIGDAFQAAFVSPGQAIRAAVAAQRGLAAQTWGRTGPLRVRMGVHVGPAQVDGADYATTHTLNRAARIMSAAHGGQVLLSAEAAAQAGGDAQAGLPPGVGLRDLGPHRMKGLTQLEHLFQVEVHDLPSDFPRPNTLDLAPGNLPTPVTSFIGREHDLAAIKNVLATSRLVTLTGSGGCGKTRLSLQVGAELQADYPHGVWLGELAPLSDPALVPQVVVAALGLRDESGRPALEVLKDFLRTKSALLILDNCEHLIAAAAQLVEAVLQACPRVRCLASSREMLGIAGETPYQVRSLAVPSAANAAAPAELQNIAAVRLFVERAGAARPGFSLTAANAPAVVQICQRLDGIPLALELAAARVRVLTVEQIAARLDDRFRLLTGGSRTALPRQQTLRALVDWSYDLLSETEQTLLRRLAVFAGGWALEAAESICAGGPIEPHEVLDLLARFVDKSLVIADDALGEARYRQLETIRQYARDRLLEGGEVEALRARHVDYYVHWAERAAPELRGPDQRLWALRLKQDRENLRAALAWSLEKNAEPGLRLASALSHFWTDYGYLQENLDWVPKLLVRSTAEIEPRIRANALSAQAVLAVWHADFAECAALAEEAISLYRELGDRAGEAGCLHLLAVVDGDYSKGTRLAQESAAMFRAVSDKAGLAAVLGDLGQLLDKQDYHRARGYFDESITLLRAMGDLAGAAYRTRGAARLAIWHCDFATARALLDETLHIQRQLDIQSDAETLSELGRLALWQGDYDQAKVHLDECLARCETAGRQLTADWTRTYLAYVVWHQGHLAHARALFNQSQERFRDNGSLIGNVYCMEGLAGLAVSENQPERALRLLAWADASRQTLHDSRPPVEQTEVDSLLSAIRAQLDPAALAAGIQLGKDMTLDEAIAESSTAQQARGRG